MVNAHPPLLAPSLLAGDHGAFRESLKKVEALGLQWIHLDIMDGHFVPNLSFGPQVLAALRPRSQLFFDTHLMLDNPHRYIEPFAKAGANLISIHVEPDYPIADTLRHIKTLGCQCGLALNPGTPAQALDPYLPHLDLVLVMSVQPGFGGQSFQSSALGKIHYFHTQRQQHGYSYRLEVDGGIDPDTAQLCLAQGADTFVAGTAFFGSTRGLAPWTPIS